MNTILECSKRKCKWIGTDTEKARVPHKEWSQVTQLVCPKCGEDDFYRTNRIAIVRPTPDSVGTKEQP